MHSKCSVQVGLLFIRIMMISFAVCLVAIINPVSL